MRSIDNPFESELRRTFDNDVGDLEAGIAESEQRVEEQKNWLEMLPNDIKTIADVGCGAGYHSKYFKEHGMVPTAIDRLPKVFQFHGEIEFLNMDIFDVPKERKFDAIFCSHVLEHFPDPLSALLKIREHIVDNGYLIVVVPPYDPVVCNYHWITGWNVSQLAMFLIAAGFDCSEGIFAQFGIHVCGFGKKIRIEPTRFNIKKSLKYLPQSIAREYFTRDQHEFIDGNLSFADKNRAWKKGTDHTVSNSNFRHKNYVELEFREKDWKSIECFLENNQLLDLSDEQIVIISLLEGQACSVRLALGNGTREIPFENSAELWMQLEPGINIRKHSTHDFKVLRGSMTYSKINQISFGGWCSNCIIHS